MRTFIKHAKHGFKHKPFHMTFLGVLFFGSVVFLGVGARTITSFADPQPPFNFVPPSLSGTTAVGQTMSTSVGAWAGSPTSYTYQWRSCDSSGNNCSDIGGATNDTYTVQAPVAGGTLRAVVTGHNADGEDSATTDPSSVVQAQLGDLNSDGVININDLGIILGYLGCASSCGSADLDSNGAVAQADLDTLLGLYQP